MNYDERKKAYEEMRRESGLGAPVSDAIGATNFQVLALQLCWSTPTIEVIQEFMRQAEFLRLDFAEGADRARDELISMVEDAIRRRALEECRHHPASEVMQALQNTAKALSELVGLQDEGKAMGQRL